MDFGSRCRSFGGRRSPFLCRFSNFLFRCIHYILPLVESGCRHCPRWLQSCSNPFRAESARWLLLVRAWEPRKAAHNSAYIGLQRFVRGGIFATPNGLIWLRNIVHDFATSQYDGLTAHILDGWAMLILALTAFGK